MKLVLAAGQADFLPKEEVRVCLVWLGHQADPDAFDMESWDDRQPRFMRSLHKTKAMEARNCSGPLKAA